MKLCFHTALLFAAALVLCGTLTACKAESNTTTPDGLTLTGKPLNLSDYSGKWVFVNYWAHWCHACREEIPALNAFQKHHKNVAVLGVNFDRLPAEQVSEFAKRMDIQYSLIGDFSARRFGVSDIRGLPTTLVFSPKGKLTKILEGSGTEADFERYIS